MILRTGIFVSITVLFLLGACKTNGRLSAYELLDYASRPYDKGELDEYAGYG